MFIKSTIALAVAVLLATAAAAVAKEHAHRPHGQTGTQYQQDPAGGGYQDYDHTFCCS